MFNFFKRKVSAAGRAIAYSVVGRPVWMGRDYAQFSKEGYQKCVVAKACVHMVAQAMASVPWCLFRGKEEIEDDTQHPLLKLLARPHPMQGGSDFFEAHFAYFLLQGNTYLEGVGPGKEGDMTVPTELWSLRPDRVRVVPGEFGLPMQYIYECNGQKKAFDVDPMTGSGSVMHWKTFHPTDDWYGMSPLEAAAFAVDQHNEAGAWNQALLQNSAKPSGAFVMTTQGSISPSSLTDAQYQQIRKQVDETMAGGKNAGRPLILDGGLDWKAMSLSPTEMDWLNGKDSSSRDVCAAFGVPPQMIGVPGSQTHANYEEARLSLYEDTVIPLLSKFTDALNSWLVPAFGAADQADALTLKLDLDEVPALAPRRATVWTRVATADWLTVNEKRAATGYEDLPEGDVIFVDAGKLPLEEAANATLPDPNAEVGPDGKPIPPKEGEEEPDPTKDPAAAIDNLAKALARDGFSTLEAKALCKLMYDEYKYSPDQERDDHGRFGSGGGGEGQSLRDNLANIHTDIMRIKDEVPLKVQRDMTKIMRIVDGTTGYSAASRAELLTLVQSVNDGLQTIKDKVPSRILREISRAVTNTQQLPLGDAP